MCDYQIAGLPVAGGTLGIAPLPGHGGVYADQLSALLRWAPGLVLSMTGAREMAAAGAAALGRDLARAGVAHRGFALPDMAVPGPAAQAAWPELAEMLLQRLAAGGRVLVHCKGGCGRSGMVAVRLMVLAGEAPEAALARLRRIRPCAVETAAQRLWAFTGETGKTGKTGEM